MSQNPNTRVISEADIKSARVNNQFTNVDLTAGVLDTDNERSVIFLEHVFGSNIIVSDKDGQTIIGGAGYTGFTLEHGPLRINEKMTIAGAITAAKGFVVQ